MKSFPTSLVTGLVALLVTCSAAPYVAPEGNEVEFTPENGFAQGPSRLKERVPDSPCQTNAVYHLFKSPPRSVAASSFCSDYIRPTSTFTSTTTDIIVVTEATTQTVTEATTTVVTATVATTTELCATPTTPVICGLEALGNPAVFISTSVGLSGEACHRLCLVTSNCRFFQTQANSPNRCNLFNAPAAGNVQAAPGSGFMAYDRDCTDLLPAGCTLGPNKLKRQAPLPTGMSSADPSEISAACTCLITSAPPASTSTVVVPVTTTTTTTDVTITTVTNVQTDTTDVTYVTYTTVT